MMLPKRSRTFRIRRSNYWLIKFNQIQIIILLFFVEKYIKALPVKNVENINEIEVKHSSKTPESNTDEMTRGRRQNAFCCSPMGQASQLMPPIPPPHPMQQQCICMPTGTLCVLYTNAGCATTANASTITSTTTVYLYANVLCANPSTATSANGSPQIQPCECIQVTVRVQPGVICPCPPPLPPPPTQMAPPLPPPVCICTPIQQDPCCLPPPPPPPMPPPPQLSGGGQPMCLCTPGKKNYN
uniref:Uncharacterized protein n=1 Tax=Meloidogyne enterolobii TaxID=390850 RepID=A0A6V7WJW6_MELEN|nr:unnamed protein product [Meloidogyne enterolobii]